jgi:hypothetical protein
MLNFPHGISAYGSELIPGGLPVSFGKIIWCDSDNGNDGNTGFAKNKAVRTLAQAYALARSGYNDVIVLSGNATHTLTSMLDITKNRVHIIGESVGRRYGQAAKVSLGVTTAATDIATVQNTGVRNSFRNIKFMNSNTVAEGIYCFAEGGEYTVFENCEFYKETDLDVTGAAEVLMNGDSPQFFNCTFGSLANIIADNVIRPNVLLTATLSGKKCRDAYFENCQFWSKAGGTEHVAVYGANATDVERLLMFKECSFINNPLSAATPAHAVGFGAAQTQGAVVLKNCTSVDYTVMAQASVGIYVDGAVPTFATSGVSVLA